MKSILIFLIILHIVHSKFDELGRYYIVEEHNKLRISFAVGDYFSNETRCPPAANMIELQWSSELEQSAQKYAESCRIPSLEENNINFYNSSQQAYVLAGLADSEHWANEFYEHGWPTNIFLQEFVDRGISSATKMIWATSRSIGCGVYPCPTNGKDILHVVCKYDGNVNVVGQEIYKIGQTCTACPQGMQCRVDAALCSE